METSKNAEVMGTAASASTLSATTFNPNHS